MFLRDVLTTVPPLYRVGGNMAYGQPVDVGGNNGAMAPGNFPAGSSSCASRGLQEKLKKSNEDIAKNSGLEGSGL